MKVCHISLVGYPYVSSWGYQENHMIDVHHKKGHEVYEITMMYVPKTYKGYIDITEKHYADTYYVDSDGTIIYRLNMVIPISDLRWYKKVYVTLDKISPDVIFVHDLHFLSLFAVTRYKQRHPNIILKGDIHATFANSCRNPISKYFLHGIFYRYIVKWNFRYFQKVYYLTEGAHIFFCTMYGIDRENPRLEFMPLGGIIISEEERIKHRHKKRESLDLKETDIMLLHSGKLVKEKRTLAVVEAFKKVKNEKLQLYIAGSIPENEKDELLKEIRSDSRIKYLGWISADELKEYLYAADLYIQPGTESSTLQTAMCCGCPCALNLRKDDIGGAYSRFIHEEDVYEINNTEDIRHAIESIAEDKTERERLSQRSMVLAHVLFDYEKQIDRIIKDEREGI